MAPGEYRIEVAAEGQAEGAVVEAMVYGDTRTLEVEKAVVKAPGSLVGRLVQGGTTVAGAWVHVYGMQRASITDASGRFAFADLPEGDYHLMFRMRKPYGHLQVLTLPTVGIEAGKPTDLGDPGVPGRLRRCRLRFPGGALPSRRQWPGNPSGGQRGPVE